MGALTVQKFADRIRRQFGDTSAVLITDAAVYDWINDAMRDIVLSNDLLAIRATTATVANQISYKIPNDLLQLHHVSFGGEPLEESNMQEVVNSVTNMDDPVSAGYPTGTPQFFWFYGNQLFLYPAPATSSSSDLLVYYNRMPVEITAMVDIPELPARYDNRIMEYCLAQAAELDDDTDKYSAKKTEFKQGVADTRDLEQGTNDVYSSVTVSPADGAGGYYYDY